MSVPTVIRIGWNAARRNFAPMLVLWGLSLALVLLYYHVPAVSDLLAHVANWQTKGGSVPAMLNRMFFGGILPGTFMAVCPSLRPRRPFVVVALMSAFSGALGLACEAMYGLNAVWFGEGIDGLTLAAKTFVAQFLWTPLLFCPLSAVFSLWIGCDCSLRGLRAGLSRDFLSASLLPNLVANWLVWIPAMFAVHAFPTPLQIQLSGFVGSFWVLMLMALGRNAGRDAVGASASSSSRS